MSWRIVSEPWEYGYAQHLHEEMPFKDKEQSMIEEVVLLVVNCTLAQLYKILTLFILRSFSGQRRDQAPD